MAERKDATILVSDAERHRHQNHRFVADRLVSLDHGPLLLQHASRLQRQRRQHRQRPGSPPREVFARRKIVKFLLRDFPKSGATSPKKIPRFNFIYKRSSLVKLFLCDSL